MVRRRLTLGMLAVAALAASPATPARGADEVARGLAASEPRVVGERVLFGVPDARGAVVWAASRDRGPRKVVRIGPPPRACDIGDASDLCRATLWSFDASETHLATTIQPLSGNRYQTFYGALSVAMRRLPGAAATLESCAAPVANGFGGESTQRFSAPAVEGARVAYVSPCGGRGRLVVHDAAQPASGRSLELPAPGQGARLAGPYAAALAGKEIVVFDLRTGERAYAVPHSPPTFPADAHSFDLQADGKLVVAEPGDPSGCRVRLRWHSPSQPQAHPIPVCAGERSVRMGADRVAYPARGALVVSDLAGSAHPVGTPAQDSGGGDPTGFDFDGRRIAFVRGDCLAGAVVLRETAAPATAESDGFACWVATPRSVRVSRSGRAVVRVRCPEGCGGYLGLRLGRRAVDATSVSLRPGASRRFAFRLRPADRRRLARRGRLSARLRFDFGVTFPPAVNRIRLLAP